MPTLTFYANDEVALQLEKLIEKRSKELGFTVSRGDILTPYIKQLFQAEFQPKKKNGNGAHYVGKAPVAESGTTSAEEGKS